MRALFLLLFGTSLFIQVAFAQPEYDLLLKGGHVIDPKNGISARRDVAIKDGKIAAVSDNIPASKATRTVLVTRYYVTPGLIDMHVHVYAGTGLKGYNGDLSVYPDNFSFRSGVTTMVDAGTSGFQTFPDFKQRVIDRAKTRVLAFLNIVGKGMGEVLEQDTTDMGPKAAADMAAQYKDVIVGFKTAHYRGPDWTSVEHAVEAGTLANLPVMVDFGVFKPERPYQQLVLEKLRPGDISTHQYLGWVPILDDNGKLLPYLAEARKRGVIFDVGHGGGSFLFRQAVPAVQQGFKPDSISTDLHTGSMNNGMKDMLNLMSKFLNMGMSIDDVVLRSTWNPAKEIRHEELGTLTVGAIADVTVLSIEKGDFGFVDSNGARMRGTKLLHAELTIRNGKVVWDLNGITRDDWNKLGPNYRAQGDPAWDGTISNEVRRR
jgi:dihydroorotase